MNVRNSERPVRTWLGGNSWVPSARRTNERTMTIRVKDVIMIRIAGARERTVRTIAIWSVEEMFSGFAASFAVSSTVGVFSAGREAAGFEGFSAWAKAGRDGEQARAMRHAP